MLSVTPTLRSLLVFAFALLVGSGCSPAGKTDWQTKLSPAPPSVSLEPRPARHLVWLRVNSVQVPEKTPGGIDWDDGDGPDPLVQFKVNKKDSIKFEAQTDNFAPSWMQARGGNFDLDKVRSMQLELRDADGLNDKLVGIAALTFDGTSSAREISLEAKPVGRIQLQVEPAHALVGLGFDYKLYNDELHVIDVLSNSPASRAGIVRGDKLMSLGDKKVRKLRKRDVKSILNSVPSAGLQIVVLHKKGGTTETVTLAEGPIYALYREYGPVP